ncbi:hypothetical protein F7725_004072 [Dissostichus mawsoni]|uniref:Uncharacterized protein n=1 Tax=Dissostichus mawsoni TaxID=36200 RepID=A0A7J5YC10_DISMA|nr:hypothetical protein F7725_004072 [Dissostichus mawsoni]
MKCIKGFWDGEDEKKIHSCPQCRQSFTPRPVLLKNTICFSMMGRIRKAETGSLFEHKQATNAKYKYAFRFIQNNEDTMRADSLARKLRNNSCYDFWKEVKVLNSCKTPLGLPLKECVGQAALLNCGDNTIMSCSTVLRDAFVVEKVDSTENVTDQRKSSTL